MILGLLGVGYHKEAPAVVPKSTVFTFLFAPELKTGCSNGRCSLFRKRKGEWRSNTAVLKGFSGYGRRVTYQEFEVWVVQPSWKGGGIEHVFYWSGNSQVVPYAVPGSPK